MAPAEFRGLVANSEKPNRDQGDMLTFFAKDAFKLRTLLLLGAIVQALLSLALPATLAFTPAVLLLTYSLISTSIEAYQGPSSPYMKDVILGRTSAQLPSQETSSFGSKPAAESFVVFHFGVRFNHPLGMLAPGAQETIKQFTACNDLVLEKADQYGLLGLSPWRAGERGSSNTLMMVYYFRNVESLNKFAHDDIHRKAWDWIVKAGHKHIGFFHEAFCVPAGAYESIYVNFQPLLMGAASVKCQDEDGNETWVSPVVDADVGPLKSQFSRMGRAVREISM